MRRRRVRPALVVAAEASHEVMEREKGERERESARDKGERGLADLIGMEGGPLLCVLIQDTADSLPCVRHTAKYICFN